VTGEENENNVCESEQDWEVGTMIYLSTPETLINSIYQVRYLIAVNQERAKAKRKKRKENSKGRAARANEQDFREWKE